MEEKSESDCLNIIDTFTFFKFHLRHNPFLLDSKKDRKKDSDANPEFVLSIEHSQYTDVDAVGLQVWSGALLLSDYVIHESHSILCNKNILELSSGTGFVSIIASKFCEHVTCTDLDEENILNTIQSNFARNKSLVKATFAIQELNFFKQWSNEIINLVKKTDIVLVSEVIYDNEITDGFIETLRKIFTFQPTAKIYMTVEKRFVFTLVNLRVEAVHYDYFFQKINELKLNLNLQKLNTDFPRYFFEYDRIKELELWKISQE